MDLDTTPWTQLYPYPDQHLVPRAWNDCDLSNMPPDRPESVVAEPADDQWTEV